MAIVTVLLWVVKAIQRIQSTQRIVAPIGQFLPFWAASRRALHSCKVELTGMAAWRGFQAAAREAQAKKAVVEAELETSTRAAADWRVKCARAQGRLAELEPEVTFLEGEVAAWERQFRHLQQESDEMARQLEGSVAQCASLKRQLARSVEACARLQRAKDGLDEHLANMAEEWGHAEMEKSDLEEALKRERGALSRHLVDTFKQLADAMLLPSERLRDLKEELGSGAYSTVEKWELVAAAPVGAAVAAAVERVAVKPLSLEAPDDNPEDFESVWGLHELALHSSLQHPHILALLGTTRLEDGCRALVLELADSTLQQEIEAAARDGAKMPLSWIHRVARQLAGALAYVHERGLIHFDVKPDNILLKGGDVKLADFGLSSRADRVRRDSPAPPGYSAPELREGGGPGRPRRWTATALGLCCLRCSRQRWRSRPQRPWRLARLPRSPGSRSGAGPR